MFEFVEVICRYNRKGDIYPMSIVWHNGVQYVIDRIIQRCNANINNKNCIRYTCVIQNQRRYLYLDKGLWFIERK